MTEPAILATTEPASSPAHAMEAPAPSQTLQPTSAAPKIDWIKLAMTLREPEVEILKLVYQPEPTLRTFQDVYIRLERLGYSNRTARRKIASLAGQGLVVRVYSVLGFVGPAKEHAEKIPRLLAFVERRRQYPNVGQGVTEELRCLLDQATREVPGR